MTEAERISAFASVSPALAEMVVEAADQFGFSVQWLRSSTRRKPVYRCRQWIARQARAQGYSWWEIARALNRDHSTIIHSVKEPQKSGDNPLPTLTHAAERGKEHSMNGQQELAG